MVIRVIRATRVPGVVRYTTLTGYWGLVVVGITRFHIFNAV